MRPAADRMPAGGTAVASVQPWRWPAALVALAALALAAGGLRLARSPHEGLDTARGALGAALFAEGADAPLRLLGPAARLPLTEAPKPVEMVIAVPPQPSATQAPAAAPPATAPAAVQAASPQAAAAACERLLKRLPTISAKDCAATHLAESGAFSVQGTPLYWRDVLPPKGSAPGAKAAGPAERPLRVLVVGAMHGDELTAAALAMRWIELAQDGAVASRQPVHWRFIPVLNPDGLLARKPTRVNAHGVDLNRNFPTPNWERDAPIYWDKRTRRDPRRWPGPTPLSEPESRFLHTQMDTDFKPDLVVSIHAPYGVLDYDGPLPPPNRLGQLRLDQLGIFPGSLGHYGSVRQGMPVVTIELKHELHMPDDGQVLQMWRDLLRWMDNNLADAPARNAH